MNREELLKISRENLRKSKQGSLCECYDEAFIKGYGLAEKQIAELKDDLCRVTSDRDGYRTTMLSYEHKIKDLEEQLGSKQMQSRKETSDFVWKLKAANEQKTEQLTKAKELLQRVVKWATTETGKCEKFDFILVDTKQFLEEVDK